MASGFQETCAAFLTRQRECGDTILPELVALRVRLDRPAGIAARDAEEGREALLVQAHEEFATDSTDEAISQQCVSIAADATEQGMADFAACLEQSDCATFGPCDIAMLERHWTSGS